MSSNRTTSTKPRANFADLTLRQRKLVDNYLILGNKEKAAIKAGYSARSAYTTSYSELNKDRVQEYYQYRLAQTTKKNQDKIGSIVQQLTDMATADMRDFVDKNGNIKDITKVNGRLIQSIKHTKHGPQLTLCSREKALELLGRYLAIYSDKVDVTSNGETLSKVNVTFQEVVKKDE